MNERNLLERNSNLSFTLFCLVIIRWIRAIKAPSNSVPLPVLIVVGEKAFQMMDSQMLVAMKREIPEPSPYPFCSSSSRIITTIPAANNCKMMSMALPAPKVFRSPYMPETTYAMASPMVMRIPKSFCAPLKRALSSFKDWLTSMILWLW